MANKEKEIKQVENNELSYDTKTLITVITLVTIYPVGLILMFVWMKWSKWIKFLVAFPVIFILLIPLFILLVMVVVTIRVVSQPENSIKTFDMIREEVRKEMVITPTGEIPPTKMMLKPSTGAVKK